MFRGLPQMSFDNFSFKQWFHNKFSTSNFSNKDL